MQKLIQSYVSIFASTAKRAKIKLFLKILRCDLPKTHRYGSIINRKNRYPKFFSMFLIYYFQLNLDLMEQSAKQIGITSDADQVFADET